MSVDIQDSNDLRPFYPRTCRASSVIHRKSAQAPQAKTGRSASAKVFSVIAYPTGSRLGPGDSTNREKGQPFTGNSTTMYFRMRWFRWEIWRPSGLHRTRNRLEPGNQRLRERIGRLKDFIHKVFHEGADIRASFLDENVPTLMVVISAIAKTLHGDGKLLLFGNGGSAADAQHIAAEFVNRFLLERPPLAALALTTDSSVITSIANDYSYNEIFSKQIQALGRPGDVAFGISTSGESANVIHGLKEARNRKLVTIGLGGPPDAPMRDVCDHYLFVRSRATPRIQELHVVVAHTIVDAVDQLLFGELKSSRGN